MNGLSLLLSDALIMGTALWGQKWKARAERLQDAIQFMVEEEIDESEEEA